MFSGVGSEWEAVAAKSVKCRSSNMDDRGIIPLNGRRTMAESMTEVREQGSRQTKGRTPESSTQNQDSNSNPTKTNWHPIYAHAQQWEYVNTERKPKTPPAEM